MDLTAGASTESPTHVVDQGVVDVTVWYADVYSELRKYLDLLTVGEWQRREGYIREVDRDRFTVGTVLLRTVVANRLKAVAQDVLIDRSCNTCGGPHGRPRLPGTGLHASISHSGAVVAVALTNAGPVGVDVEWVDPFGVADLAATVLGAGERITRPHDFYVYWCRKEAVVKATGEGLRRPLQDVIVSRPYEPAMLVRCGDQQLACALADMRVPWDRAPSPGQARLDYVSAVAVLTPGRLSGSAVPTVRAIGQFVSDTNR